MPPPSMLACLSSFGQVASNPVVRSSLNLSVTLSSVAFGTAAAGVTVPATRCTGRAVNICTTRVIPEIMRISHILKTIKQPL